MEEEVVLLSNYLRNEGMLVSIRSTTRAHIILSNMREKMSYDELYCSLKAIYVKDMDDVNKFERAFNKVFNKIDLKQQEDKIDKNFERLLNDEGEVQQIHQPQQNLEELQQLYDEMIQDKANSKAKEGHMLKDSMLLLDSFDPKVFELCKRLSKKIANKRS